MNMKSPLLLDSSPLPTGPRPIGTTSASLTKSMVLDRKLWRASGGATRYTTPITNCLLIVCGDKFYGYYFTDSKISPGGFFQEMFLVHSPSEYEPPWFWRNPRMISQQAFSDASVELLTVSARFFEPFKTFDFPFWQPHFPRSLIIFALPTLNSPPYL